MTLNDGLFIDNARRAIDECLESVYEQNTLDICTREDHLEKAFLCNPQSIR